MIRKVIVVGMVVVSMWTMSSFAMNIAGLKKQYSTFVTNQQYKELSNWLASMPADQRQKFFGATIVDKETPLNSAVYRAFSSGDTRLVKTLLAAGASADAVPKNGYTPFVQLMLAASMKKSMSDVQQKTFKNIVNLLLQYSQSPQTLMGLYGNQKSPLEFAVLGKFPKEIVWFLFDHNIATNGTTINGVELFEFSRSLQYPLAGIFQEWIQQRFKREALTIEGAQDVGLPADIGRIINDYAPGTQ